MSDTSLRDRLYAESENFGLHEDVRSLLREAGEALATPAGVWPKTDYGPEFDWLNSPGLPEQLARLAATGDDFGDRMTIFPCDARAILANLAHISPSDPTGHEPPPDDIGPYPHGWDNYRDSSCLIADLVGAEPTFRSGNEAE